MRAGSTISVAVINRIRGLSTLKQVQESFQLETTKTYATYRLGPHQVGNFFDTRGPGARTNSTMFMSAFSTATGELLDGKGQRWGQIPRCSTMVFFSEPGSPH
jgi:hypothetical protein